jgi:hypothetical protein
MNAHGTLVGGKVMAEVITTNMQEGISQFGSAVTSFVQGVFEPETGQGNNE